jgi:CRP-like cAMP-binding protein
MAEKMIDKSRASSVQVLGTRPRNAILGQLPAEEYEALARFMVDVDLPLNKALSEPNEVIEYVYFLNQGLISTDAMTQSGESVEVGVIGREGFSGFPALLNQPQMSHAVVVRGNRDASARLHCARSLSAWRCIPDDGA